MDLVLARDGRRLEGKLGADHEAIAEGGQAEKGVSLARHRARTRLRGRDEQRDAPLLALEPGRDDALARPTAVHVGRVQERHALLQREVEHLGHLVDAGLAALRASREGTGLRSVSPDEAATDGRTTQARAGTSTH